MITPGEVRAIREVKGGVQAQVCIASSSEHGSAVVQVVANSVEVQTAVRTLRDAIAKETKVLLGNILEGQRKWDDHKPPSKVPLAPRPLADCCPQSGA